MDRTHFTPIMNLLQSFMGCMYPGSIRTESIESIDNDFPEYRFQVTNIDDLGNEVSSGELQLTDRDLIYFRPGRFPTLWPLGYIRRYGCSDQGSVFSFEAGRRCPTGQAIYAFRLSRGMELTERIKEKIDKFSSGDSANDANLHSEIPTNSRVNRLIPISTQAKVPAPPESTNQPKKDASTSTGNQDVNNNPHETSNPNNQLDPRPLLSYALIDFDTTKALNESAQAHAASRVR